MQCYDAESSIRIGICLFDEIRRFSEECFSKGLDHPMVHEGTGHMPEGLYRRWLDASNAILRKLVHPCIERGYEVSNLDVLLTAISEVEDILAPDKDRYDDQELAELRFAAISEYRTAKRAIAG